MINVYGAKEHNLKNIDVQIPRNKLTVITGLSGSGKSSLAFDTIFAEGQRRYIETFSAYARNFLGNGSRPNVDKITGLSPVISIEQKTTNKNPRSTVGTTTEVYDFLRLLYARAGQAYSYATGEKMVKYTQEAIINMIVSDYAGKPIYLLAPLIRNRKGHYQELFESMRRKGYLYIRIDGEVVDMKAGMRVDRYKNHNIEVVIDRFKVPETADENDLLRLSKSVATAMKQGDGMVAILEKGKEESELKYYSSRLMCPTTGLSYSDPAPNKFSFNSPEGACPHCKGLGKVSAIDLEKIIPDDKISIKNGAIVPLGKYKKQLIFYQVEAILESYELTIDTPVNQIPEDCMQELLYGSLKDVRISKELVHTSSDYFVRFEGIVRYLQQTIEANDDDPKAKKWAEQFLSDQTCPVCNGQRLNKEALSYKFWNKNIAEASDLDLEELREWLVEASKHVEPKQQAVAKEILKEILTRLDFMLEVGLDYLALSRQSSSLSGGESQRIRLATQIGSGLVNVLYILDEPSIGLHQRDNERLIASLKKLRDMGNTVIVVEHDEDMMRAADYIIDIGPKAGNAGGQVVFQGTPEEMLKSKTLTAKYLNGELSAWKPDCQSEISESNNCMAKISELGNCRAKISEPEPEPEQKPKKSRKKSNSNIQNRDLSIKLKGCRGNNLKGIDIDFPLGKFIVVTGVSGSGKSSIVNETLQPILSHHFYRALKEPLKYDSIEGIENVDKVVSVDQSPIGRTPRSNPATYTGVFADIRSLFVNLPEAQIRGYKPGRFSFNVKGGRCETCCGNGYRTIEMTFLPDVYTLCETCHGKRYNRETLEVRYKGKSIADVLDMTINEAVEFFEHQPSILQKIKTLKDVGLGYITLGQSSTTLSGGESQRVKLATELSKRDTGKTVFILDEPTTGLHFEDIRILSEVLRKLVDKGNTVIIIEHNLDIIRQADHIIDIGPEGGRGGGQLVAAGTPDEVKKNKNSITGRFI
ncbi:MAG: excinuclease ABC subunit UvrA [Bacteroidaceae bacterium]|nr:excinuclease ABC subunit UvrA [Bacteroidaceae bacterium]